MTLPQRGLGFITGLQSLLLCIAFWYTFMNNYFLGFRVINLTARTHLLFASLYLILGLQQLIAIQLLDSPRLWLTIYVLLIATVLANPWLSAHVTIIKRKGVRQAAEVWLEDGEVEAINNLGEGLPPEGVPWPW